MCLFQTIELEFSMKRAKSLTYSSSNYRNGEFSFVYIIDEKTHTIRLSHSRQSSFSKQIIDHIGFTIGMAYLVDIAEITLPSQINIFANLSEFQILFWQKIYEDVVKEKMFALGFDLADLEIPWNTNARGPQFKSFSIPDQTNAFSICMTGGKESLALLKMLSHKKNTHLFYLNLEKSVHRQKVFNAFKEKYSSIRTFSNRYDVLSPLKKKYSNMYSGVDMAHLVFNTLLFAYEYQAVLIGNEYSSNFPNEIYQGYPINHQFVKTIDFAKRINSYVHSFLTKDYSYYSPFFSLYEYRIADILFTNNNYLDVWTSCNKTTEKINFCSNCSKCAFTYLISRVRKDQAFLSRFFSRNLLNDVELYKPLMDFTGEKPLDCVGDKKEVWVALDTLFHKAVKGAAITYFRKHIYPQIKHDLPTLKKEVCAIQTVPINTPRYLKNLVKKTLTDVG